MKARAVLISVLFGTVLAVELFIVVAGLGQGSEIVAGFIALELFLAGLFLFANRDKDLVPVRAVKSELQVLTTGVLLLLRQRRYSGGALDSYRGWWVIPAAVTGATGIECIAIELLVPWVWLRAVILVVSLYSLVLLWGVFGAAFVYPHFVDGDLVLRHAGRDIARIAPSAVASIVQSRGYSHERHAVDVDTLILGNGDGTNIHIELASPVLVSAPRWPWQKEHAVSINDVRVWCDAPAEAVATIVRRIG
ncbi:hypothetical protein HMPREF2976_03815 [Corynebacterium sp. HMSC077D10]|uniref:hypothetical protein n=1 Tax=unclassified Corynebacterium TaxID=2624378 RepID=UPI0008A2712B|nr:MULTISPECIES: hypothetical protein [unclassified Corynebacterium]OFP19774.1 hypothetical protein HMPREF2998_08280 [Corynebacterium sp. HMSC065A05]OFP65000.1 hypothetical protein HMPREF2976_03815 [Corynebacterium sp. HMSC077D10]